MLANRGRAAALLERQGLSAALACSPENVLYWTGYDAFQHAWNRVPRAALVTASGVHPFLVLPMAEVGFAVDQLVDAEFDVYAYGAPNLVVGDDVAFEADERRIAAIASERRFGDPVAATLAALAAAGVHGPVAVDGTAAPDFAGRLAGGGGPCEFRPGGEQLMRLVRMVKTPAEVDRLRAAAALNERGIRAALARVADATAVEVAEAHRMEVAAGGAVVQHWQGAAGRRAGAYRLPDRAQAQPGDRFVFDTGILLDGYCSDLGGTVQVGVPPGADERRAFGALTAAIDAAVESARPGVRTSSVYEQAIAAARGNGLPEYAYSLVGHGIGVEPRDLPIVGPPATLGGEPFDPVLEAGMVLNFETPVIELGVGGYQLEVTCLVAEGGGELLSPRHEYEVV